MRRVRKRSEKVETKKLLESLDEESIVEKNIDESLEEVLKDTSLYHGIKWDHNTNKWVRLKF
jgi:hypothetical protein